jgi:transposase-like protein
MAKPKGYPTEQIILKLREVEVLLSQGQTVKQACRALEVSEQTYYRWRREYGGLNTTQAKKLKELGKENARLKKLAAYISLDIAILKEVLSKK